MNKNDPRLTGFVLGEISAEDAKIVKDAIHTDKQIATEVAAIEATVNQVNAAFGNKQAKLTVDQRKKIFSSSEQSAENLVTFPVKISRKTSILTFVAGIAALFVALFSLSSNRDASSTAATFNHFSPQLLGSRLGLPKKSPAAQNSQYAATSQSPQKLQKFQKAISSNPSTFRDITRSIVTKEVQNTSKALKNKETSDPSRSQILPLTSGLSSWNTIKEATKASVSINPATVRTEELANISFLHPNFNFSFKGIDTALEFTQCPWDENAVLAVIHIKNNTHSSINNVSVNLAVSEAASAFKVLGYPDSGSTSLPAPALYSIQPDHSHTLVAKVDFTDIPETLSSLAILNINVGERSKQISYDFSTASLNIASNATTFPSLTSYWAYYLRADNHFKTQHYAPLKQALEQFKNQSTHPDALEICNILLQNI